MLPDDAVELPAHELKRRPRHGLLHARDLRPQHNELRIACANVLGGGSEVRAEPCELGLVGLLDTHELPPLCGQRLARVCELRASGGGVGGCQLRHPLLLAKQLQAGVDERRLRGGQLHRHPRGDRDEVHRLRLVDRLPLVLHALDEHRERALAGAGARALRREPVIARWPHSATWPKCVPSSSRNSGSVSSRS